MRSPPAYKPPAGARRRCRRPLSWYRFRQRWCHRPPGWSRFCQRWRRCGARFRCGCQFCLHSSTPASKVWRPDRGDNYLACEHLCTIHSVQQPRTCQVEQRAPGDLVDMKLNVPDAEDIVQPTDVPAETRRTRRDGNQSWQLHTGWVLLSRRWTTPSKSKSREANRRSVRCRSSS